MHWPDIFFKARKLRPESELPPPFKSAPERPKPASEALQPPTIKPVPAELGPQAAPAPSPVPLKTRSTETGTRTLPAMHGVVLRAPTRFGAQPNAPAEPPTPLKNVEQLMAEADPVRTLSQTGSIRLIKRLAPEPDATKSSTGTAANPAPVKADPSPSSAASPPPKPTAPASSSLRSSPPPFRPEVAPLLVGAKKVEPAPAPPTPQAPASSHVSTEVPEPEENDSPFILRPIASPPDAPKASAPAHAPLMPFGSIFRRKAKMTELARIVLPPKREETEPPHPTPESSPTVVPPAFPVVAMTARAVKATGEHPEPSKASAGPALESPFLERSAIDEEPVSAAQGIKTESTPPFEVPRIDPEAPQPTGPAATEPPPAPALPAEEKPSAPLSDLPDAPKVDPEAHKPEPSAAPLPKVDPEAHRTPPPPAAPIPPAELSAPIVSTPPEKREFHLANGERVAGTVLSETPEAVYIEHGTLGVLTIPRAQIAKRLVEIILINGDRIVGDIMAETADTLYVRHASLGMLTVPRAQRSTRVVEAILKDGDRILGEVLTETDTFTVIRSATLGTITVPHSKVSMLNRKIEQIELKALPPPAPEIKDKPAL